MNFHATLGELDKNEHNNIHIKLPINVHLYSPVPHRMSSGQK
jgi:hypothetical protein